MENMAGGENLEKVLHELYDELPSFLLGDPLQEREKKSKIRREIVEVLISHWIHKRYLRNGLLS